MKPTRISFVGAASAAMAAAILSAPRPHADTLQLRNGQSLQGAYAGGTTETIQFKTDAGMLTVSRADAAVLTFTAPAPPPAPILQPAAAAVRPASVTVPAGTLLLVRVQNQVSSDNKAGTKFAAVLETDLTANGVVVAPAGTKVYGQVQQSQKAGRMVGKSTLSLALTQINIGGTNQPIVTSDFSEAGEGSFKKTARNTLVGAGVGAAFGDAGKGAAVGAGASVIRKGESVTVPADAILEFRLIQPTPINLAN
jgi:hypothetical protein